MRYLVVPSEERVSWKETNKIRQTKPEAGSEARSNGFNGLWYEWNKTKNLQVRTTTENWLFSGMLWKITLKKTTAEENITQK